MRGISISRPSPVVLFAFNRPEATERSLAALANNHGADESELTVICDAPQVEEDAQKTEQVRAIARRAAGFKNVRVVARADNLGSAVSIRTGLDQMFDEHETIIVLEDDFTTSVHFLKFMNAGLAFYNNEDRVVSICGYSPAGINTLAHTYLLPGAHCWGWGAWRRSWSETELNPRKALHDIVRRDRIFEFDLGGTEPCTWLLHRAATGGRDSWVLPWMASAVLNNRLTLYPGRSLVRNDGLKNSGLPVEWLKLVSSPLADHCPEIRSQPLVANTLVMNHIRSNLIRLHCGDSRRQMLYNRLMENLPVAIRRSLYSARVRRAIRNQQS